MKICETCGKEYEEDDEKSRYCSRICRMKAQKEKDLEKIRKKWKEGEKLTINEINELALSEHMSYGQWVGRYGGRRDKRRSD